MSERAQIILLRFLENHEYKPLGGTQLKKANLRIIAASNENLESLVQEKRFRQDLFFRLAVLSVSIPPLRERPEDIEILAKHFIRIYSAKYEITPIILDGKMLSWMQNHNWPGNIRELANFMQRLLLTGINTSFRTSGNWVMDQDRRKNVHDRRQFLTGDGSLRDVKRRVIDEFERRYLLQLMSDCQGNVTRAAKQAQTERSMLGKLLKKHGIDRERYLPEQ